MGVPAFYRWLTSRYPKCVVLCEEEHPVEIDGVEVPVDYTQPSPNGHVDNLYLDMNGIIHPCFHPEDRPPPVTFEECFREIFAYIDRIMAIVRPRKLLYMAIGDPSLHSPVDIDLFVSDGVAPRAKMNQQRARRFKTAKESKDKLAEEVRIREEMKSQGIKVRDRRSPTETTELSDSNIITPGTAFMAKLSVALQYYIHHRINSTAHWRPLMVVLSDANVPGEGEHKIMEYIREQRGRPGWHPNLTHVVSGLDADLIHLALATHEPNFHILREVVFGAPAGDDPEGGAKPKVPYQYLKIAVLRDYLALEFNDLNKFFDVDKERIFDDFVFLCFFVGNDFLPHSPTLEIREGGIDLLMKIYRNKLPQMEDYICNGAKVNLKHVEMIVREVAKCEEAILKKRMRIMKDQDSKRKHSAMKRPLRVTPMPSDLIASDSNGGGYLKGTPKKQKTDEDTLSETHSSTVDRIDEGGIPVDAQKIWTDLLSVDDKDKAEHLLPEATHSDTERNAEAEAEAEEELKSRLHTSTREKADMFDSMVQHETSVGFGTSGWKERYYRMKFPNVRERERGPLIKDMVEKFVEGLQWVMAYYYEGVASWTWYYPYHYAPFASDMTDISRIKTEFILGEPFLPVNQLMAVLPAASRFCLPKCLQHLFVDMDSPIIDFYPEDFKCDMNGKRFAWQAVVLLPFIDEQRLIQTTKKYFHAFTDEEKERNVRKLTQLYVGVHHPLCTVIETAVGEGDASKPVQVELDPTMSDGVNGSLCITKDCKPESLTAPYGVGEDIQQNTVCMASFMNPPHQQHRCQLMEGANEQMNALTGYDIPPEAQPWHEHPRAGNRPMESPRRHFAIDKDAAHRFVVHGVSGPRFRDEAPRLPTRSNLRADAPAFIPEHITQMALQMTGLPAIQPPLIPPADVTDAAIKLSERTRRNEMGFNQMGYVPQWSQHQQQDWSQQQPQWNQQQPQFLPQQHQMQFMSHNTRPMMNNQGAFQQPMHPPPHQASQQRHNRGTHPPRAASHHDPKGHGPNQRADQTKRKRH